MHSAKLKSIGSQKSRQLHALMAILRANGLSEGESGDLAHQLHRKRARGGTLGCQSCGRSATGKRLEMHSAAGALIYQSPTIWIYGGAAIGPDLGLCDQCYRLGLFHGLSASEIAYFREHFECLLPPAQAPNSSKLFTQTRPCHSIPPNP